MSERLTIIGAGRVGLTIGKYLYEKQSTRVRYVVRNFELARSTIDQLGFEAELADLETDLPELRDTAILVRDDAIEGVCAELASRELFCDQSRVFHCSGVSDHQALSRAAAEGAQVGSIHPLQTFPDPVTGCQQLPGCHWFYEGDEGIAELARWLVKVTGGIAHPIAGGTKTLYHCTATMACNYLTTLLDNSLSCADAAGLERQAMITALLPLVRSAIDNFASQGAEASLTGPISRGDVNTIDRHLKAIDSIPGTRELYVEIGMHTLEIARRSGRIDEPSFDAMEELFTMWKARFEG